MELKKHISIVLCHLALCFLVGCATFSKPVLLGSVGEEAVPDSLDQVWENYGAYYVYDELFMEATSFGNSYLSKYVYNKKIKIINKKGVEHAIIKIPRLADSAMVFSLVVRDSIGSVIGIDVKKIKKEYAKTGKINIPQVTPGCEITLTLEYRRPFLITWDERWFSQKIPVYHSKFTFSSKSDKYKFREYGNISLPLVEKKKNHIYHIWDEYHVLPYTNVGYQDYEEEIFKRVAIVNKELYSWEKLATSYRFALFETPVFSFEQRITKQVKELVEGVFSEYEKASNILSWVQENITYEQTGFRKRSPDRIMKRKKGNMWEMTMLLYRMFDKAGLEADILITRGHHQGGFDESFETPGVLSVPFVEVICDESVYLAYPYDRIAAMGEYPKWFADLEGLSLNEKDVVSLPERISDSSKVSLLYTVGDEEHQYRMEFEVEGNRGYEIKRDMVDVEKKAKKEYFQEFLSKVDKRNALDSLEATGLSERGKDLRVYLDFYNDEATIKRKGKTHLNLSPFFQSFFTSIDSSRTLSFYHNEHLEIVEEVTIGKGDKQKVVFKCENEENKLFHVACETKSFDGKVTLKRTLIIPKGRMTVHEVKGYIKNIRKMNSIKESYIIY